MSESDFKKRSLKLILLFSFLNYIGSSAWDVVFPDIIRRINGSVLVWGYAYSVFNLTRFLFQIPNARLSDKFGRKIVISVCLGLFGIGSLLAYFARTPSLMIVARAIQGAGALSAVILAAIGDLSDSSKGGMVVAGRNIVQTVGWVLGMIIGGIVGEFLGISWVILLCVFIGFGGSALALIFFKEERKSSGNEKSGDIIEGDKGSLNEPDEESSLKESISAKNIHWVKQILKNKLYVFGLIFGSIRYFLYQAIISYLIWFLAEVWGISGSNRILFLLPVIFFYIIGIYIAGRFNSRGSYGLRLIIGGFLLISLGALLIFSLNNTQNSLLLILYLIFISIGLGLAHNTLTTAMVKSLPSEIRGSGLGFSMSVNFAFITIAPISMSFLAESINSIAPFAFISIIALITAVFCYISGRRKELGNLL